RHHHPASRLLPPGERPGPLSRRVLPPRLRHGAERPHRARPAALAVDEQRARRHRAADAEDDPRLPRRPLPQRRVPARHVLHGRAREHARRRADANLPARSGRAHRRRVPNPLTRGLRGDGMRRALLAIPLALLAASVAAQERPAVPSENDPRATEPPPRPPAGDTPERAARLFEAIVRDDPNHAREFFFPREPFLILKGIADPGRYWDVLWRHYERDIHELHASLPEGATFDRFVMSRRGGWVER